MIKNYLKVAWRSIFRNKLTAFINIAGLALAMTCAVLIYLFVQDEINYEKYHNKADRIYRVTRSFHSPEGVVNLHLANVSPPIGPLLKNDFGEIEELARTINYNIVINLEENGEIKISNTEDRLYLAEPSIFKIFDIKVTAGDPAHTLNRPFTVMLSKQTAIRYFNSDNVVGKRLRANNAFDLEVTGVYEDFTAQSHWHPDFLVSFSTLENENIYGRKNLETNWGNNSFGTYILLQEGSDHKKMEAALPQFLNRHFGTYAKAQWGAPADWEASKSTTLYLQKLTDIHLHSHLDDELEPNGNINTVYMMGAIGAFIVLIACFNFVNLSTARATKRAKEVGLRKVVGAFRSQLVGQYLSESIITAGIAFIAALLVAGFALNWLNPFVNKELSLISLMSPVTFAIVALIVLIIGILAGVYPAFVISAFKPALTLKGQQLSTSGKGGIRRILVIAQFSISIVLIIATLVTFQQLSFLNTRELGYAKDQVVTLNYYNDLDKSYDSFYNELLKSGSIEGVCRSSRIPTGRLLDSYGDARILDGDSMVNVSTDLKTLAIDEDFFSTYNIELVAGRAFSRQFTVDDTLSFIVNEAAAKAFGWKDPVKNIGEDFYYAGTRGKLIGVVKDFHFESLHQQIVPMIFVGQHNFNALSIKINEKNMQQGLANVEKIWKSFLPAQPFEYSFLSERYRSLYEAEQKQSQLFATFAGLAIFIAGLGLFGLATFNTLQRIKEIGIRKVLGASVGNILALLSKEMVLLVLISNVIAWPVGWYLMNKWLSTFAYHASMNVVVFALAMLTALFLAFITVGYHTMKAALKNPASTLRYE